MIRESSRTRLERTSGIFKLFGWDGIYIFHLLSYLLTLQLLSTHLIPLLLRADALPALPVPFQPIV